MARLGRTYAARPIIKTALKVAHPISVIVGLALETDTAFPVVATHAATVGLALETDEAFSVNVVQAGHVGLALETDEAFPVRPGRAIHVGFALETDEAFPVVAFHSSEVGLALEADSAFSATPRHIVHVGFALETDEAFSVDAHTGVLFIVYEEDIIRLSPIALPASLIPTPQTVELIAALNWTPLTDIAGSVTGATREALAGTGRTVRSESTVIGTRQKPARTYALPSLYRFEADALTRAGAIRRFLERGLKAYSVTFNVFRNQVEIGMVGRIDSYPRFGLSGGFTGVVVAWSENATNGQVTMVLLG